MKEHIKKERGAAVSGWEDDGAAQRRLDASHESDARGEHRYDDVHQTEAEQKARRERDNLKQRLAGRVSRRAG